MIVQAAKNIEITADDRAALKQFLDTRHGKNVMAALALVAPVMVDEGTAEVMIASGQQRKGFEKAITTLFEFITPEETPPEQEAPHYPSIDDDAAWEAQQLQEEQETQSAKK